MQCSARQVSSQSCVMWYDAKRIPQVIPIPGFDTGQCNITGNCFAYCVMQMAGGRSCWTEDGQICPPALSDEFESWTPLVVNMVEETVFPFSIVRGRELIGVIQVIGVIIKVGHGMVFSTHATPVRHGREGIKQLSDRCKTTYSQYTDKLSLYTGGGACGCCMDYAKGCLVGVHY